MSFNSPEHNKNAMLNFSIKRENVKHSSKDKLYFLNESNIVNSNYRNCDNVVLNNDNEGVVHTTLRGDTICIDMDYNDIIKNDKKKNDKGKTDIDHVVGLNKNTTTNINTNTTANANAKDKKRIGYNGYYSKKVSDSDNENIVEGGDELELSTDDIFATSCINELKSIEENELFEDINHYSDKNELIIMLRKRLELKIKDYNVVMDALIRSKEDCRSKNENIKLLQLNNNKLEKDYNILKNEMERNKNEQSLNNQNYTYYKNENNEIKIKLIRMEDRYKDVLKKNEQLHDELTKIRNEKNHYESDKNKLMTDFQLTNEKLTKNNTFLQEENKSLLDKYLNVEKQMYQSEKEKNEQIKKLKEVIANEENLKKKTIENFNKMKHVLSESLIKTEENVSKLLLAEKEKNELLMENEKLKQSLKEIELTNENLQKLANTYEKKYNKIIEKNNAMFSITHEFLNQKKCKIFILRTKEEIKDMFEECKINNSNEKLLNKLTPFSVLYTYKIVYNDNNNDNINNVSNMSKMVEPNVDDNNTYMEIKKSDYKKLNYLLNKAQMKLATVGRHLSIATNSMYSDMFKSSMHNSSHHHRKEDPFKDFKNYNEFEKQFLNDKHSLLKNNKHIYKKHYVQDGDLSILFKEKEHLENILAEKIEFVKNAENQIKETQLELQIHKQVIFKLILEKQTLTKVISTIPNILSNTQIEKNGISYSAENYISSTVEQFVNNSLNKRSDILFELNNELNNNNNSRTHPTINVKQLDNILQNGNFAYKFDNNKLIEEKAFYSNMTVDCGKTILFNNLTNTNNSNSNGVGLCIYCGMPQNFTLPNFKMSESYSGFITPENKYEQTIMYEALVKALFFIENKQMDYFKKSDLLNFLDNYFTVVDLFNKIYDYNKNFNFDSLLEREEYRHILKKINEYVTSGNGSGGNGGISSGGNGGISSGGNGGISSGGNGGISSGGNNSLTFSNKKILLQELEQIKKNYDDEELYKYIKETNVLEKYKTFYHCHFVNINNIFNTVISTIIYNVEDKYKTLYERYFNLFNLNFSNVEASFDLLLKRFHQLCRLLQAYEHMIKGYEQNISNLNNNDDELYKQNKKLKYDFELIRKEKDHLKEVLLMFETNVKKINGNYAQAEKELNELKNKFVHINDKYEHLKNEKNILEQDIIKKEKNNEQLNEKNNDMLMSYQKDITYLQTLLQETKDSNIYFKQKVEHILNLNEKLKYDYDLRVNSLNNLWMEEKENNKKTSLDIKNMKEEKTLLINKINDLENKNKLIRAELNERMKQLNMFKRQMALNSTNAYIPGNVFFGANVVHDRTNINNDIRSSPSTNPTDINTDIRSNAGSNSDMNTDIKHNNSNKQTSFLQKQLLLLNNNIGVGNIKEGTQVINTSTHHNNKNEPGNIVNYNPIELPKLTQQYLLPYDNKMNYFLNYDEEHNNRTEYELRIRTLQDTLSDCRIDILKLKGEKDILITSVETWKSFSKDSKLQINKLKKLCNEQLEKHKEFLLINKSNEEKLNYITNLLSSEKNKYERIVSEIKEKLNAELEHVKEELKEKTHELKSLTYEKTNLANQVINFENRKKGELVIKQKEEQLLTLIKNDKQNLQEQLIQLSEKYNKEVEKNKKLENDIELLINNHKKEIITLNEHIDTIKKDNNNMNELLQKHININDNNLLKERLEQLNKVKRKMEDEIQSNKEMLEQLRVENSELKKRLILENEKKIMDHIQQQDSSMSSSDGPITDCLTSSTYMSEQFVDNLQTQLKSSRQQLNNLSDELDRAKLDEEKYKSKIESLKEKLVKEETEKKKIEENIFHNNTNNIIQMNKIKVELEMLLDEKRTFLLIKDKYEKEIEQLKKNVDTYMNEKKNDIDMIEKDKLKEQIDAHLNRIKEEEKEKITLNFKIKKLENENAELKNRISMYIETDVVYANRDVIEGNNMYDNEGNNNGNTEFNNNGNTEDNNKDNNDNVLNGTDNVEERESIINSVPSDRNNKTEISSNEIYKYINENIDLTAELENKNDYIDKCKEEIKQKSDHITELCNSISTLTSENKTLKQSLNVLETYKLKMHEHIKEKDEIIQYLKNIFFEKIDGILNYYSTNTRISAMDETVCSDLQNVMKVPSDEIISLLRTMTRASVLGDDNVLTATGGITSCNDDNTGSCTNEVTNNFLNNNKEHISIIKCNLLKLFKLGSCYLYIINRNMKEIKTLKNKITCLESSIESLTEHIENLKKENAQNELIYNESIEQIQQLKENLKTNEQYIEELNTNISQNKEINKINLNNIKTYKDFIVYLILKNKIFLIIMYMFNRKQKMEQTVVTSLYQIQQTHDVYLYHAIVAELKNEYPHIHLDYDYTL
ncbi:conserved protein, unknown function [Hepatocystis sp. ex Piliocolobus tephrosceles]|nr:conserved protein, unknown function [Hepatocystis sp. ex Piliocolobus tephrosceles]